MVKYSLKQYSVNTTATDIFDFDSNILYCSGMYYSYNSAFNRIRTIPDELYIFQHTAAETIHQHSAIIAARSKISYYMIESVEHSIESAIVGVSVVNNVFIQRFGPVNISVLYSVCVKLRHIEIGGNLVITCHINAVVSQIVFKFKHIAFGFDNQRPNRNFNVKQTAVVCFDYVCQLSFYRSVLTVFDAYIFFGERDMGICTFNRVNAFNRFACKFRQFGKIQTAFNVRVYRYCHKRCTAIFSLTMNVAVDKNVSFCGYGENNILCAVFNHYYSSVFRTRSLYASFGISFVSRFFRLSHFVIEFRFVNRNADSFGYKIPLVCDISRVFIGATAV